MNVVLDTWAVVRYLDGASSGRNVATLLDTTRPIMNWVNLGEIHYLIHRRHGAREANRTIADLRGRLTTDDATPNRVLEAAHIMATHALSYADAFAAATAIAHDAELWTGDPELLVAGAPWRWHDLR